MLIFILLLSILLDLILGELPLKIHPVVIIGNIIDFLKIKLIKYKNKLSGLILTLLVTCISTVILLIIFEIIKINMILFVFVYSLILSSMFSIKLLLYSAVDVKNKLYNDINAAKKAVSYLVSRDTEKLTENFVISATIESLSENITDSYISPIFYFAIFSLFLKNHLFILLFIIVFYRIINTLDAMVGYKTKKLKYIGFVPAKLDDILNFIPSRIASIFIIISSYILGYDWKNSFKILKRDAKNCPSPNSGYTMAPTAGALNIQLVKKNVYKIGDNNKKINPDSITESIYLSILTIILFTIILIILMVFI